MNKVITIDAAITTNAVRAQVGRILASEAFARARRMQRFLEYIVEETLADRADQLGEFAIGMAVFDRDETFEPALDPIVRNDARRLRTKLLEYYRQLQPGSPDHVQIDVPKGGYVPRFGPVSSRSPELRLAVLPFEDLSMAGDGAKYGRAVCMSLTASLTNVEGLETIAHGFAHHAASHVIQGSVLKNKKGWSVIVNLIGVADGRQLWAQEYDLDSSEIAATIRDQVAAHLGLSRNRPHQLAVAA